jgi:transcriptional regulator with XRE-family HTH domain
MTGRRRRLAERRKACGLNQESLAEAVGVDRSTVQRWESGRSGPHPWQRPRIAKALGVTVDVLAELLVPDDQPAPAAPHANTRTDTVDSDEYEALELARRVGASDVGAATLDGLEAAFDRLAMSYPVSPPQELLARVRRHCAYVGRLLDGRATLAEQRRLHVLGGWFQLLGATLHIDLGRTEAATARLNTAATLARHAEHHEIEAWCYETEAWRVLTAGDYHRALDLSLVAQELAPPGSSVLIQATAQEGRARARLADAHRTYGAIDRVQRLSDHLPRDKEKEHHYQYDPGKSLAYTATTLAWLGDPAAEPHAREVIARLAPAGETDGWPRRVASATIDLALTLIRGERVDEACDAAQRALLSGKVAPSNHWRALEVVTAVEAHGIREAAGLRESYESLRSAARTNGLRAG